jgi:hypothetical protein
MFHSISLIRLHELFFQVLRLPAAPLSHPADRFAHPAVMPHLQWLAYPPRRHRRTFPQPPGQRHLLPGPRCSSFASLIPSSLKPLCNILCRMLCPVRDIPSPSPGTARMRAKGPRNYVKRWACRAGGRGPHREISESSLGTARVQGPGAMFVPTRFQGRLFIFVASVSFCSKPQRRALNQSKFRPRLLESRQRKTFSRQAE